MEEETIVSKQVIELLGVSGVGKTYYSKLLANHKNYDRVKLFNDGKIKLLKFILPAFMMSFKLKPKKNHFKKTFCRALHLLRYRTYVSKNEHNLVLDQGVLYKVYKLHRTCQTSYERINKIVFEEYKIPLPDAAVHVYAERSLIYDRRIKRGKPMDENLKKANRNEFTKLSDIKARILKEYAIPTKHYLSKQKDAKAFIDFMDHHLTKRTK